MAYILAGVIGTLTLLLVLVLVVILFKRLSTNPNYDDPLSPTGARLLSKARYRGRKVAHYSDGSVIAETRFGQKTFESFDAYRHYVDRR